MDDDTYIGKSYKEQIDNLRTALTVSTNEAKHWEEQAEKLRDDRYYETLNNAVRGLCNSESVHTDMDANRIAYAAMRIADVIHLKPDTPEGTLT